MVRTPAHPRILERATTTLRNRQAQQQKAVAAIDHAIELEEGEELRETHREHIQRFARAAEATRLKGIKAVLAGALDRGKRKAPRGPVNTSFARN